MRKLVNYTYDRRKDKYTLLEANFVLADEPNAVLDTNLDIDEPLIVPSVNRFGTVVPTVVDRKTYEERHKKFRFNQVDESGKLEESVNGSIEVYLPRDTDVSKLRHINGQVVLIEEEENEDKNEKPIEKDKKEN